MTTYRFKGRATGSDPTGYYYPRFGTPTHYGWTVKWDSVNEEPTR